VFSRLLTPKWLLLHLLVAVLFVATFFLGYWQLSKAEAGGGAVNWSYAMQWPLYGFMGLWFYLRMVRLELHRDPDDGAPGAAVVLYQRPRIDTTVSPAASVPKMWKCTLPRSGREESSTLVTSARAVI